MRWYWGQGDNLATQKGKCYKVEGKREIWDAREDVSLGPLCWRDWWEEKQQARAQKQRLWVDINSSQWEDIEEGLKAVWNASSKTSSQEALNSC